MTGRDQAELSSQITQDARGIILAESVALAKLADALNSSEFGALVAQIVNLKGKVIVTGIGKSGLIGAKITATLASTGTPAQFMHSGDASHGDLGMVSAGDMIIALSNSGQSRELYPVLTYAKRFAVPLVSITSSPDSPLARASQTVLLLPKLPEACPLGLAPMTSTTMQLAMGDALAGALIKARGFSRDDFALRHMGGSLGLRTKSIDDYLVEVDHPVAPSVGADASFDEVLSCISAGRKGACLVTDSGEGDQTNVLGIITDGDIRRALQAKLLNAPAHKLMTANPVSLNADRLLMRAVSTMQEAKINVLVARRQDGQSFLLHLQDLLALGL